jgi:hypothetical protein
MWAKMLRNEIGIFHHVKCLVCLCSFVKGKDVILGPKVDTFENHAGKTKVVRDMLHLGKKQGKWDVNKKCNHAKNEIAYSKKNHLTNC